MSISINQKLTNAGDALFSLAGDLYERAAFDDGHVQELFHANALGSLGCMPPIAEQVVESFMKTEGYTVNVLKVLKHNFSTTDFTSLTQDESQRSWYGHIAEDLKAVQVDNPPAAVASGSGAGEHKDSGNKFYVGHKVTSKMEFPVYNGEFGKATHFISQIKGLAGRFNYDESDLFTILMAQSKGHAHKTIKRMEPQFGEDFTKHSDYFISYYDKGEAPKDKKYTNFMAKTHQQNNESVQIFRQRFDETSYDLIEAGLLISFRDNPDGYKRQQADLFLSKLNSYTRDYVHEQMEKEHKSLAKCDIEEIFDWAVRSERKKPSASRETTSANFTPCKGNEKNKPKRDHDKRCYYCGKKGHDLYIFDRKGHRIKDCFAAKNGEEPIDLYKKYLKDTYDITWMPRKKKPDKPPSGVFDFDTATNDTSVDAPKTEDSDVSAATMRWRGVAVTNDVNIQGKNRWFNGIDLLTDSDGCENLIDHDFAKYDLRIPVQEDTSPLASIESQGIGGTAKFREFIETKVNFKGKQKLLRFYLLKNLPRRLLIGWPTLRSSGTSCCY